LLSGRGSNFLAIADAIAAGKLDAEIAVVISNRMLDSERAAPGIAAAAARGLNAITLPSRGLDREVYDRQLVAELEKNRVDLVCLAGYMRLLSGHFIRSFPMRILNIHPSLLPAFPGLDAQHQALEHGVKFSDAPCISSTKGSTPGPSSNNQWSRCTMTTPQKRFPRESCERSTGFIPKRSRWCAPGAIASTDEGS